MIDNTIKNKFKNKKSDNYWRHRINWKAAHKNFTKFKSKKLLLYHLINILQKKMLNMSPVICRTLAFAKQ